MINWNQDLQLRIIITDKNNKRDCCGQVKKLQLQKKRRILVMGHFWVYPNLNVLLLQRLVSAFRLRARHENKCDLSCYVFYLTASENPKELCLDGFEETCRYLSCPQWQQCHHDLLYLCAVANSNRFYLNMAGLRLSAVRGNFHATPVFLSWIWQNGEDQLSQGNLFKRPHVVMFKIYCFVALLWLRALMPSSVTGGTVLLWTRWT